MARQDGRGSRSVRDTLYDDEDTLSSDEIVLESEGIGRPRTADIRPTDPSGMPDAGRLGVRMPAPDGAEAAEEDPFGELGPGAELGGRYRLERTLGKGATGAVFEASHLVIGKRVALKCLYPQHRANANAVERFFREARIAATVEHPNVIQVFDGGEHGQTVFLAMQLLHGESLGARLERGPMTVDEAMHVFLAIMDGVSAVHEHGVVHRDLKPDNVFLVRGQQGPHVEPKVLDFGISKLKEPGSRELTTLGTVLGTPFYMAPEQIANTRDVDVRADVYALGIMLYEALVGEVPYPETSVLKIFQRVQKGTAAPLRQLLPELPEALTQLVHKAMDPAPEERFATVAEMRDALARVVLGDTDRQMEQPPRRSQPATVEDLQYSADAVAEAGRMLQLEAQTTSRRRAPAERGPARSRRAEDESRRTVSLRAAPPPELTMPAWAVALLVAAAAITTLSVLTAIVALAT